MDLDLSTQLVAKFSYLCLLQKRDPVPKDLNLSTQLNCWKQIFLIFVNCRLGTRCSWTWICPQLAAKLFLFLSFEDKGPGAH